jgi:hypothetical protein
VAASVTVITCVRVVVSQSSRYIAIWWGAPSLKFNLILKLPRNGEL